MWSEWRCMILYRSQLYLTHLNRDTILSAAHPRREWWRGKSLSSRDTKTNLTSQLSRTVRSVLSCICRSAASRFIVPVVWIEFEFSLVCPMRCAHLQVNLLLELYIFPLYFLFLAWHTQKTTLLHCSTIFVECFRLKRLKRFPQVEPCFCEVVLLFVCLLFASTDSYRNSPSKRPL